MQIKKVYLAPMEGVCDPPMRKILTKVGGYDECFSEFIRVSDLVLPYKTLLREVPELEHDAKTQAGTLVRVQLLGDNPTLIAKTAKRAEEIGAKSIDLNFGCPSRFVHHAGSMLLKEPSLLHEIVATTLDLLDPKTFLSVKIRTGFEDKKEAPEIVKAIAQEGVKEIIIHARTRRDLYREEALDWSVLHGLWDLAPNITLVANGEISSYEKAQECAKISGCDHLMVGRGALMVPNAGHVIKEGAEPFSNDEILRTVFDFMEELMTLKFAEKSVLDRAKQFLGFARRQNESLGEFFKIFCKMGSITQARELLSVNMAQY